MPWYYRFGIIAVLLFSAFSIGIIYGKGIGRQAALQGAVNAYQAREGINHEVSKLDDVSVCIALGGLPDECADMLRMDATAEGQAASANGQK